MFEPISAALEPLRAGKLRALAVTGTARAPALPDLPTFSDFVPGFEASAATGGRLMAEETEKWAKVVKFAGHKTE